MLHFRITLPCWAGWVWVTWVAGGTWASAEAPVAVADVPGARSGRTAQRTVCGRTARVVLAIVR